MLDHKQNTQHANIKLIKLGLRAALINGLDVVIDKLFSCQIEAVKRNQQT